MDVAECEEIEYAASAWDYVHEPTDSMYTQRTTTSGARQRDWLAMRHQERIVKSSRAPLT